MFRPSVPEIAGSPFSTFVHGHPAAEPRIILLPRGQQIAFLEYALPDGLPLSFATLGPPPYFE